MVDREVEPRDKMLPLSLTDGNTTPHPMSVVWQVTEPPPKSELLALPLNTPRGPDTQHTTLPAESATAGDRLLPPRLAVQNVSLHLVQQSVLELPDIFHEQINLRHGGAKWFDAGIRFDPTSLTVCCRRRRRLSDVRAVGAL